MLHVPSRLRFFPSLVLASALAIAATSAFSCTGTNGNGGAPTTSVAPEAQPAASVRLYLMSNVAGAIEPCGCSKDQLGGADHFAAYVAAEKSRVQDSVVLGAGPLFFQDPTIAGDGTTQAQWKADALAQTAKRLGIAAWAPGANDFASGIEGFRKLEGASGVTFLAANVKADKQLPASKFIESGGIKIGVVGVAEPKAGANAPAGVEIGSAAEALKREVAAARAGGARIVVALASVQRGDALRLVDSVPDIDVLLVGKPSEKGDLNDQPKPATLVGDTVVVETSNHLQTVAVLDLYLREPEGTAGRIKLTDGGGLARAEQLVALSKQVRDLETRINGWEQDKNVKPADLAARRSELDRLRQEKAELEGKVEPPPSGSYFKYSLLEVREKLGEDPGVGEDILSYYRRVNDHNREALKDRKPLPLPEGQAGYIGVEQCSTCHAEERKVWDKTDHAKAYPTLEKKFVEFNLDCVGCHVTGYDRPGGSTVTFVDAFKNVQCETCHGPGSLHAKEPDKKGLIVTKPEPKSCVSECHHPPHVENFDPVAKMPLILGPGHGR
ncbi:MAG: hypothetical protein HOW73_42980 [Polyangiaceae bacterium]|nr:hypothetical protein [Polyangiaceae bacterium]